jgi:hypothetical protein
MKNPTAPKAIRIPDVHLSFREADLASPSAFSSLAALANSSAVTG